MVSLQNMNFEFRHTDDYEIIISHEAQKEGRDFHALVNKYFSDKDDLIFCLLEMVTLSDIDAIGETYLYSTYTKKESQEILAQYKKIVNKVLSTFDNSISEYLDWYKRSSYILIKANQVEYFFPYQAPNWEQEPSSVENEHDRSKYGKQIENRLNEKQIQKYLQYYANLLHKELGFKEYPHYCIIVRPISVVEGKEVIPLGNSYLHFATMNERNIDFYLHLINDFLIVWFKRKGVKIIREIQHKTIVDYKNKKEKTKGYLPHFTTLHSAARKRLSRKLDPINLSLEDYYDDLFNKIELKQTYLNKLKILKESSFPKFFELKEYLTNPENKSSPNFSNLSEELGFSDKLFGIQGQSVLSKKYDQEHFIKTLIRREFFKIGLLIFKIEPHIIRNILMNADDIIYNSQSSEADYTYLWTELFIPWLKTSKQHKKRSNRIIDSLSEFEKSFLEDCKKYLAYIKVTSPNFSLTI